jgi:hypothetical protein
MPKDEIEVTPPTPTDLVVPQSGASTADIRYALNNGIRLYVNESEGTEEEFLLRQLDRGGDESSILGETALTKLEDLLGSVVKVTAYHGMRNSTFEGSRLGVFVIFELTDRDGTTYTTSAGSADIVLKVTQLREADAIPTKGWVVFERSEKATKNGYYPINMKAASDPNAF